MNENTAPANLGIEIAPQAQLESLLATLEQGDKGKGKEVAAKVDVGKVAEKVVKNVRRRSIPSRTESGTGSEADFVAFQLPTLVRWGCQAHVRYPLPIHPDSMLRAHELTE